MYQNISKIPIQINYTIGELDISFQSENCAPVKCCDMTTFIRI